MKYFHSQCFASCLPFKFQEDETNYLGVVFKGPDASSLLRTLEGWSQEIPEQIIHRLPAKILLSDLSIIEDKGRKYCFWGPLSLVRYSCDSPLSIQLDRDWKPKRGRGNGKRRVRLVSSTEGVKAFHEGTAVIAKKC